jgi:hypothetical protein
MGKNVYVATKFERFVQVRVICNIIESLGHTITHNWAWDDQFDKDGNVLPWVEEYGERYAWDDFKGAQEADLTIVWDHPDARGAIAELGITLGAGGEVWFCEQCKPLIFKRLPQVRTFGHITQALCELGWSPNFEEMRLIEDPVTV